MGNSDLQNLHTKCKPAVIELLSKPFVYQGIEGAVDIGRRLIQCFRQFAVGTATE